MAKPNIDHIPPSWGEKVPSGGGLWLANNTVCIIGMQSSAKNPQETRARGSQKKVNVYLRSWNKISDPLRGHKDQTGIFRREQQKKRNRKSFHFYFPLQLFIRLPPHHHHHPPKSKNDVGKSWILPKMPIPTGRNRENAEKSWKFLFLFSGKHSFFRQFATMNWSFKGHGV